MRTLAQWHTRKCQINLEWKWADKWMGAYDAFKDGTHHVWVILLPALPIHIIMPEGKKLGPVVLTLLGLVGMLWLPAILVAIVLR